MHLVLRIVKHIPYILLGLIPFIFFTAVTFLEVPPIWPDEAIFADTVNSIITKGRFATNLFLDIIPGLQHRALWYPPLYFSVLSFWVRLTGFDIVSIRLFSILCASVSLVIIYAFSVRVTQKKWFGVIGMILLGIDYSFLRAGQVGRMDVFAFLWIIAAVYVGYEARIRKSLVWVGISGILSGLAIVTHPLGCIAPAVVALYLFISRYSYRRLMQEYSFFLLPVLVSVVVWYLWIGPDKALFFTQYQLQFARKAGQDIYPFKLAQHFLSWRLLFFLYGGIGIYACTIRKQFRLILLLTIGTALSLAVALWGKEMWYTLYLQPWISLYLILVLNEHSSRRVAYVFLSLYIIFNIWLLRSDTIQYASYTQMKSALARTFPRSGTIYLSSIPDPYFILHPHSPKVSLLEFPTVPVSDKAYKRLLGASDYIIINQVFDERLLLYIKDNMQKETTLISADDTKVGTLIKLKPRNKRK